MPGEVVLSGIRSEVLLSDSLSSGSFGAPKRELFQKTVARQKKQSQLTGVTMRQPFAAANRPGGDHSKTGLAPVHFPEVFFLIVKAEEPVARIVSLATIGAGNEAAQMHPLPVIVL